MFIKNGPPPKGHPANWTQLWEILESTWTSIPTEHLGESIRWRFWGWLSHISWILTSRFWETKTLLIWNYSTKRGIKTGWWKPWHACVLAGETMSSFVPLPHISVCDLICLLSLFFSLLTAFWKLGTPRSQKVRTLLLQATKAPLYKEESFFLSTSFVLSIHFNVKGRRLQSAQYIKQIHRYYSCRDKRALIGLMSCFGAEWKGVISAQSLFSSGNVWKLAIPPQGFMFSIKSSSGGTGWGRVCVACACVRVCVRVWEGLSV